MNCCSTKAGHNLDPAETERLMTKEEPASGFLRLILHGPLIVWFDGSYEGYGYDRLYWAHDAEAIIHTAAMGLKDGPDPRLTPNVGPLDPDVWVPTVAYKAMAKKSAPNYTPTARVFIWQDRLIAVQGGGDEPALFSLAPMEDRTTCDRPDLLGACPKCGSGELKEVVMGYPRFDIVGDPNYELGGCVVDGRRGGLVCASCGHESGSSRRPTGHGTAADK